jgi:general nucleoside transport system permease protein
MSKKIVQPLFLAAVIILGAIGVVLWLASYFIGVLFIIGAGVLFFVYRLLLTNREVVTEMVRGFLKKMFVPVMGIAIAIILGAIIMLVTGYDPIEAYKALFYGGFVRNWNVSVLNATPLIFTGLSVAFAFKAGLFNIGAEGQYYVGAMAATFFGITIALPPVISLLLIFVLSGLFASAWVAIPALLKTRTGAHEVITTMMFAHIARYSSSIFIRQMGGDPATSTHAYVTWPILESNWLPRFKAFLPEANYRVHVGILIGIAVALIVYYILFYTKLGFEIRAVGQNPDAAKAQGISKSKNIFLALLIAGFLSGIAGFSQVTGLDHKLFENLAANYGWNGISVALLAAGHPIGVIFTALLWGALDAGGQYMARTVQTPNAIVEIIKGIILFLVVARYIYTFIGNRIRRRKQARQQEEAA